MDAGAHKRSRDFPVKHKESLQFVHVSDDHCLEYQHWRLISRLQMIRPSHRDTKRPAGECNQVHLLKYCALRSRVKPIIWFIQGKKKSLRALIDPKTLGRIDFSHGWTDLTDERYRKLLTDLLHTSCRTNWVISCVWKYCHSLILYI